MSWWPILVFSLHFTASGFLSIKGYLLCSSIVSVPLSVVVAAGWEGGLDAPHTYSVSSVSTDFTLCYAMPCS